MNEFPPRFEVILTNDSGDQLAIPYQLLDTPASKIWLDSTKKALVSSSIRETRCYNFSSKDGANLKTLLKKFHVAVQTLSEEFPELLDKKIDETDLISLQSSMNDLHRNFAHNHLVEMRVTPANCEVWHEFNGLIHRIESELVSLRYPLEANRVSRMRIEFEWGIPYEKPIPQECFKEFSLEQYYGDLNIIYCDVGRHLYEIYHAGDIENIPLEHIRPHRRFSANTGLNFGPRHSAEWAANETNNVHVWFMKHEEKFSRAGVFWDQPSKALGHVTVAKMINAPDTFETRSAHQKILVNFNKVKDVRFSE